MRCPTCMIAVAVAQPQHGIQVFQYKEGVFIMSFIICIGI